jgi:signal transduction histidine kinase
MKVIILNKKLLTASLLLLLSIFNFLGHKAIDNSNTKKFIKLVSNLEYKDKNLITYALKMINESDLEIYLYLLDSRKDVININDFRANSFPILPEIIDNEVITYSLYNSVHLVSKWSNEEESLYFVYDNKSFLSGFSYYFYQFLIFLFVVCLYFIFMYRERMLSRKEEVEKERTHKDLLLALSHEINTPLAIIQGYVDLLYNKRKYDKNYIGIIQKNLDKLESNLVDILELSSKKFLIDSKHESIRSIIEKTISNYKVFYPNRSISLVVHNDFNISHALYHKLLFSNIINNFYRYSKEDSSLEITLQVYENFNTIDIKQLPKKKYKDLSKGNGLDIIDTICKVNNIDLYRDNYFNYTIKIPIPY